MEQFADTCHAAAIGNIYQNVQACTSNLQQFAITKAIAHNFSVAQTIGAYQATMSSCRLVNRISDPIPDNGIAYEYAF